MGLTNTSEDMTMRCLHAESQAMGATGVIETLAGWICSLEHVATPATASP